MGQDIGGIFSDATFLDDLTALNDFSGAGCTGLLFERGMLFGSREKWWGGRGGRPAAHEGLDIRYYRDGCGAVRAFRGRTLVPALAGGAVVRITGDLMGRTVFVRHEPLLAGMRLFSIYAHVDPAGIVHDGSAVSSGNAIAVIADTAGKKGSAPPHLHLSLALVPEDFPPALLDWKSMGPDSGISFLDPLERIGTRFEITDELMAM